MKVVVAMSGGVDSSVAAALLKREGHQVIGITMQLLPPGLAEEADRFGGCCGLGAIADAQGVARRLGIPHYVVNFREAFARRVIDDFSHEYSLGRTPNPCIRCNQYLKFDALLGRARALGADMLATGHYARIEPGEDGRHLLRKSRDHNKDQTYVLYMMTQEQLARTLFPIGGLTKDEVRRIADELELPVADKPDSQEICFVPDNDYAGFLARYTDAPATPGPIIDRQGNILGEHRGIVSYTIGQRKGLGIASPEARYVVAIDRAANAITVGGKEETFTSQLIAADLNWVSIERPEPGMRVFARIRYRHQEAGAMVNPLSAEEARVTFDEAQTAIAPGQAIVFYDGDSVVGGGTIAQVGR